MKGLGLVVGLIGLAAARQASALPALRLWLAGGPQTLGSGGADPFLDEREERLSLRRPTLLAGREQGFLSLSFENESIVSIRAGEWSGTSAHDRRLHLTAAAPVGEILGGVGVTAFASVRYETAVTHLERRGPGELIHFDEDRTFATIGAAASLPYGLSAAISAEQSSLGAPGYATELAFHPRPEVSLWYQRRQSDARYRLRIPPGVASRLESPELEYRIDHQQREDELGARFQLDGGRVFAAGGALVDDPGSHFLEVGGRPLAGLLVRAGFDQSVLRLRDPMRASGSGSIATVDLGLRRSRMYGGADLELGARAGALHARYVYGNLGADSEAQDAGTVTARALLDVDVDLGLLFQGDYAIESHQVALGWDAIPLGGRFQAGVGAQYLRLVAHRGDYQVTSSSLQQSLASAQLHPARLDAVGLTAQLVWRPAPFDLSLSAAQLVPISFDDGSPAATGGGGGGGAGGVGSSGGLLGSLSRSLSRIGEALDRYGGGNLVVLRGTLVF